MSKDYSINGYIYNVTSYEKDYKNESINFVDIFYINIDDKLKNIKNDIEKNEYIVNNCLSCLRFFNFYSSFYLVKLPGMTEAEFKSFIQNSIGNISGIIYKFKTEYNGKKLVDASYFNFGKQMIYAKIKSKSSKLLNNAHKILKKACKQHYQEFTKKYEDEPTKINKWDKLFFENTETPFRFDMTTLNTNNIRYYLSTKYNIPCAGGFTFEYNNSELETFEDYGENNFPGLPFYSLIKQKPKEEYKIHLVNMHGHNNIFRYINHNEYITGQDCLTLMSYDIETYENSLRQLDEKEKIIMCIGVGFFNITNDKPFIRYCLSFKDLSEEDLKKLEPKMTTITKTKSIDRIITNEYTQDKNDYLDKTHYLIYSDERNMLMGFIRLIGQYKPTFITGFNNYGFDDRRINDRLKYFKISQLMDRVLQYYNFENKDKSIETQNRKIYKSLFVKTERFPIKIDGEMYNDNETWRGETNSFFTDTYKIMLASNAKLYTQQGRGNLDTMLSVNKIKNPFNGCALSKSGLTYQKMWDNWDKNIGIYEIFLYCCQDAWICGTLLIKSCQLIDKIEMSTLSCTTISDSIFKAVTWRVKHLIEKYAWDNNFAVSDNIFNAVENGTTHVSRADNHELGYKQFDTRQIVGGEVKNVVYGRQTYIIALDFSAMYPSQKEGSNIDTSSMVPTDIINNPTKYGLEEYHDKIEINDMYNQREIRYYKNKKGEKFVIEEFMSEFKNKKDEIQKLFNIMESDKQTGAKNKKMYEQKLSKLLPTDYIKYVQDIYYNNLSSNDLTTLIKNTEIKHLYAVQSPRNDKNKVVTHYSLKEIMLSDLRALRSSVKKQMAEATNSLDKNRYNSKQNAIKIMCNSEYGASNSSYFPYYDPLIGGATTAASRCLINFLTNILEADSLYVNERFLKDNEKYLQRLVAYKVLTVEKLEMSPSELNTYLFKNRKYALRELYNDFYEIVERDIYVIRVQCSQVVYQDTDSNYYTNEYIKNIFSPNNDHEITEHLTQYYKDYCDIMKDLNAFRNYKEFEQDFYNKGENFEDPIIINLKMNLLLDHNNFIGNFIKDSILRNPVAVGFEGAFIVVRYFNVKKKYYGIVWNDKMTYKMPNECYDENKILKEDFDKNWKPFETSYPLPNGDYIKIDEKTLLDNNVDKLSYIKSQNIKLTGVDLVRRDQYKFINANHVRLVREDLHFLKYLGGNVWKNITNVNMLDIVKNLLKEFKQQFIDINTIINNMLNNVECSYDCSKFYDLRDYAKDISFKYTKGNFLVCTTRVDPDTNDYIRYFITDTKEKSKNGKNMISYSDTYSTVDGNFRLILERDSNENYISVYSDSCDEIFSKIAPEFRTRFYLKKYLGNDELAQDEDEFYIDYDCVRWDKKNKIMTKIGDRVFKVLEKIKVQYQRRLTDREFSDNFPSGFSRKQYVVKLTKQTIKDRLSGNKTENVHIFDKVYLIKELHKNFRAKLPEEKYNKLLYHDRIPYKRFIDLQIIDGLDHIYYMDTFCSVVSLYLVEYADKICHGENLRKKEGSPQTITDIKNLIAWYLLIDIYPEKNMITKPKISQFKKVKGETTGYTKTSIDDYKILLTSANPEQIIQMNKTLPIHKKINIVGENLLNELKQYEKKYNNNKQYKEIVKQLFKTLGNIEEDITFKTVCERCNIIINACSANSNLYYQRLKTLNFLDKILQDNNYHVTSETLQYFTPDQRNYYKRFFKENKMQKQEKELEEKQQIKNIELYKEFINFLQRLNRDINIYNEKLTKEYEI